MTKCYMCKANATTREHFPPKSFFPKGKNLQLWTVPSCINHNNKKSGDDQYFLTKILMNMSREDNLARNRFMQSIAPHFDRSPKFRDMIARGSRSLEDGARAYLVDISRMWNVMDGMCHAIIFRKFELSLPSEGYQIQHEFCNFTSEDASDDRLLSGWISAFDNLTTENSWALSSEVADKLAEEVYSYKLFAPAELNASITIEHKFYGGFKVISLLTNKKVNESVRIALGVENGDS